MALPGKRQDLRVAHVPDPAPLVRCGPGDLDQAGVASDISDEGDDRIDGIARHAISAVAPSQLEEGVLTEKGVAGNLTPTAEKIVDSGS